MTYTEDQRERLADLRASLARLKDAQFRARTEGRTEDAEEIQRVKERTEMDIATVDDSRAFRPLPACARWARAVGPRAPVRPKARRIAEWVR